MDFPSDRRWTSEHVRYHSRAEDETCAGVIESIERHLALIRDTFNLRLPGGFVIDYYKYLDDDDFERSAPCPDRLQACTNGSSVWSSQALDRHELTHVYFSSLGRSHAAIEEGIAVALDCDRARDATRDLGWNEAFATPYAELDAQSYAALGRFAGFLVHEFGSERFTELYRTVSPDMSSAEVASRFENVYGVPLSEVWSSAVSVENPEFGCLRLWECAGPELELGAWQVLGAECSAEDSFRTLEVQTTTAYTYQSSAGEWTRLASCAPERPAVHERSADPVAGDQGVFVLPLDPGRYFLGSVAPGWAVRVDSPEGTVSATCGDAAPLGILAANLEFGITAYLAPGSSTSFLRFDGLDLVASELLLEAPLGLAIRACAGCEGLEVQSCVELPSASDGPARVQTHKNLWFEISRVTGTADAWFRLTRERT